MWLYYASTLPFQVDSNGVVSPEEMAAGFRKLELTPRVYLSELEVQNLIYYGQSHDELALAHSARIASGEFRARGGNGDEMEGRGSTGEIAEGEGKEAGAHGEAGVGGVAGPTVLLGASSASSSAAQKTVPGDVAVVDSSQFESIMRHQLHLYVVQKIGQETALSKEVRCIYRGRLRELARRHRQGAVFSSLNRHRHTVGRMYVEKHRARAWRLRHRHGRSVVFGES